jgi:CRISPR-associated protein Cmr5
MNKIEKLLPAALDAAKMFITTDEAQLTIPKQFKGYISSFGASVIQSGLMPTLAFYSDAKKAKGDRSMLIPALIHILFENKLFEIDEAIKQTINDVAEKKKELPKVIHSLFDWLLKTNGDTPERLRKELMDASIALKLALRTFREEDKPKKQK